MRASVVRWRSSWERVARSLGLRQSWVAGLARVDAGPAQHVEALGGGERLGHVGRAVDVDHAVAAALGPEDGVAGPGVRGDLEVDARPSGAQPPDQLGDQAFPLERAHPGDHGHPAMEVEGVRSLAGLNHESLEVHPLRIGAPGPGLEPKGLRLWAIRLRLPGALRALGGCSSAGCAPGVRRLAGRRGARPFRPGALDRGTGCRGRAAGGRLADRRASELGPGGGPWHDGRSVAAGWQRGAPLAQSAERFHGKEKVDSSILSGGSRAARSSSRPVGPAASWRRSSVG